MLQIDEDAVDALGASASLRIAGVEADGEVELEIEDAAEPAETATRSSSADGVRVFLDAVAATALDDQVLGVDAHDDHFHFTFDDQSG